MNNPIIKPRHQAKALRKKIPRRCTISFGFLVKRKISFIERKMKSVKKKREIKRKVLSITARKQNRRKKEKKIACLSMLGVVM